MGHELPRCGQNAASALPAEAAATVVERCVRFGPISAARTRSKNSLRLRRRTTVKSVTDLLIAA
jgi:hypothetical protein